jgi:hypothetical protein
MFWKKKKTDKSPDSKIILGMIMLEDDNSFALDSLVSDYINNYDETIQEPTGDDVSLVLEIEGEMVAIAHIPAPIPSAEIEGTAQYAYNWPTAVEETKDHKSHLIVSVLSGGPDQIKRFKIFTQVICSLLRTTNAIGVYKGNQSLLIPREDYLEDAGLMSDEYLPLNLWIYFGLRVTDQGNSAYTYGLNEFTKTEMEIINSGKSLEDLRAFLFNIAHYVLDFDVTFQDKQTCGLSEDERIEISYSKGIFVEGKTFKLAF